LENNCNTIINSDAEKKMNRSSRKSKKTKKNINQDAIHTDSTAQQDYFVHNNVSLDDTTPKQAGCSSVRRTSDIITILDRRCREVLTISFLYWKISKLNLIRK